MLQTPVEAVANQHAFRFYDNRQKYLLFVNTCSEKWVIAQRAAMELAHIHPRPPAVRLFDAGVGDGTVLARLMRAMHRRFPTLPFYIVGNLFRYHMHTLPTEIAGTIGASTLFAAWNAAIYVGQVEDSRLEAALADRRYLDVTREVLQKHGGLWFWDESYVISRRQD